MSKKDNFNEAVYSMFGVGKAPVEAEKEEVPAEVEIPEVEKVDMEVAEAAVEVRMPLTRIAEGTALEGKLVATKKYRGKMVKVVEKLIKEYAIMAADSKFKGIFAVVSDPVDQLCLIVLKESKSVLAPEQIKGYGLGVMNARALYYSKIHEKFSMYFTEGRAYGPHGKDLIIANSIVGEV